MPVTREVLLLRCLCLAAVLLTASTAASAQWLDPDRHWSGDQWQHAALGAALDLVVRGPWIARTWRDTALKRLGWVMALGCVVLESYQVYESHQHGWLGQPGGGFGLLDCLAVAMGGLVVEITLRAIGR